MKTLLYATLSAPRLPEYFHNEIVNQTGTVLRHNYAKRFVKSGIEYENLIQERHYVSDELNAWIKENIGEDSSTVTSCYARARQNDSVNSGNLGPHTDDLRNWVLNYYLDFDEDPRPATEFYINQTGRVIHTTKNTDVLADQFANSDGRLLPVENEPAHGINGVRSGPQRHQLAYNNSDHLTTIARVEIPKYTWVLLNAKVLHDLVGVREKRISLMIDFEDLPVRFLDDINETGIYHNY